MDKGTSPLHVLASRDAVEDIKLFLQYQGDLELEDCYGLSPLAYLKKGLRAKFQEEIAARKVEDTEERRTPQGETQREERLTDCKHFIAGTCHYGRRCRYRHLKRAKKTEQPCAAWIRAEGCTNAQCEYRHPSTIGGKRNCTDCIYFIKDGRCARRESCKYRHSSEARQTTTICPNWKKRQCNNLDCPNRHPGKMGDSSVTQVLFTVPPCSIFSSPHHHCRVHRLSSSQAFSGTSKAARFLQGRIPPSASNASAHM